MPVTPYNTGKVKIGCHYVPPQQNYSTQETEFWQPILLRERRDTGEFWRWVVLVVIAFGFGFWGLR